jgi:hypothetical protein
MVPAKQQASGGRLEAALLGNVHTKGRPFRWRSGAGAGRRRYGQGASQEAGAASIRRVIFH